MAPKEFKLIEHSDDEVTVIKEDRTVTERKPSKFKQLVLFNVVLFSVFVIPLIAISRLDQKNILERFDKALGERCYSSYWKPKNLTNLEKELDNHLFGQHIAKSVILSALKRRWSPISSNVHHKPLVMSFHGWTGSGKNFVAKFIAESLFRKGLKSSFVRTFISTVHFHDETKVKEYQENLREWVLGNVTKCPETLFIFDEVDKMPVGVLNALKPYMEYHSIINGVDMSQSVFLLLSNTGGREITQATFDFWKSGKKRSDIRYADYEQMVLKGAFNEVGGLQKSQIIEKSLIDVYVPFLPLEQCHVRQCAESELVSRGFEPQDFPDIIDQVLIDLSFWPSHEQVYSSTGCKRVSQKVDELLYEHGL